MDKNELGTESLTLLGRQVKPPSQPSIETLEIIPNRWSSSDYTVRLDCQEFTCICPATGQPDFGEVLIDYIPDEFLVESKSLKLYLGSYRNHGIFHEFVINQICDDLVKKMQPKWIEVKGLFKARGGISIHPTVRWQKNT